MAEVTFEDAPRKARELFDKGFAAMERGNLDYAMDMFMASLEIEPRLLRARKFLRAAAVNKFKAAKGGAATHLITTLTGAFTLMSGKSQLKKKPEQALKTAEKLLRTDPFNLTFIQFLTQAAEAADLPEVGILTMETAREQYASNIKFLDALGNLYLRVNRTHDGRACFEEINRQRPNDPKYIKAMKDSAALDTMQKGGWNEAQSYRDVMKDSKEANLLEQESKAVKSNKDMDALIRDLQIKCTREPENINYKRSLADMLARADRYEEALKMLTEAFNQTGGSDPQIDRALSALKNRHFDYQIAQLNSAGKTAEAEAKQREKVAFLLKDAEDRVQRYPNDLQFKYEYGVLLFEHGKINEAIQEFQLSSRNPQRRIRSLYFMGLCFKQKNQFDIALEQFQKAVSELSIMDDNKKDILYEMGTTCDLMGDLDKAIGYFKEIYAVDIRFKDVADKIDKAYKKKAG